MACVGPKDRTSASLFQLLASQGALRAWASLALTALLPLFSGHVAWAHPFSRCHTGRAGQAVRSPRAGQRDSSVIVSEAFDTWWVAGLETALRRPRVPEVGRPLLSGIAFFRYRLLTPKNGVCPAPLTPLCGSLGPDGRSPGTRCLVGGGRGKKRLPASHAHLSPGKPGGIFPCQWSRQGGTATGADVVAKGPLCSGPSSQRFTDIQAPASCRPVCQTGWSTSMASRGHNSKDHVLPRGTRLPTARRAGAARTGCCAFPELGVRSR